ncbi:ParE toxin of type II toxin-antitoxin system, parDE [Algoriphagus alkaliphilus]|uniref:ParE toxin of type II toxin-antitoxin system, parDE n=1 Tax=Algoriphagus alkaliphilus TaxID=279824 RepID=A0A1G5ZH97_9BACT|nr:ParE toxin of type II toxin-antitoxin system, parDE [Algoriphagus alkaliphilus]
MEFVWTYNASEEYIQILEYLEKKWSLRVANKFVQDVDEKLELLLTNYYTFQKVEEKKVQKFLINKHITLFYLVEGKKIVLLHFWNNSQDPNKLSL